MTLRIGPPQLVTATLVWTAISVSSGFALSRYIIDAQLRSTDAVVRRTAEDLDRSGLVMTEHVLQTTRALDQKINALVIRKEQRK